MLVSGCMVLSLAGTLSISWIRKDIGTFLPPSRLMTSPQKTGKNFVNSKQVQMCDQVPMGGIYNMLVVK